MSRRPSILPKLTHEEAQTFRALIFAVTFNGFLSGAMTLMPEVARKSLDASGPILAMLTVIWPVGQLFASYWSAALDGLEDRKRLLLFAGTASGLPLLCGFFIDSASALLFLLIVVATANSGVLAAQHAVVQGNFRLEIRAKLFSFLLSILTLSCLVSALFIGWWLDQNRENYRYVFVLAGLAAFMEILVYARTPIRHHHEAVCAGGTSPEPVTVRIIRPWKEMLQLFREDRAFFRYEMNFMVYGFGFMIMQPFITIFFVDDLSLSFTQISLAKGAILQAGVIIMSPLSGRLLDRRNPVSFAAGIFLLIALFPLMLASISYFSPQEPQYLVYASYAVLSVGWAGLNLVWHLGSLHFAAHRDVSRYSGTHVVMVGLRGILSLIITIPLISLISPFTAFLISAGLWLLASALMRDQHRKSEQSRGHESLDGISVGK